MSYPLGLPSKDHVLWGKQIPKKGTKGCSLNDQFADWFWFFPPKNNLPAEIRDLTPTANLKVLKDCIGYVVQDPTASKPHEDAIPVCIRSDQTVIPLPVVMDKVVFGKHETMAVKSNNFGKLYDITIPIIPQRLYKTVSEKHKYHYLQQNFSQVQIQNGIPSQTYVTDTPKELPFDPKTMGSQTKSVEPVIQFDMESLIHEDFELVEPRLKESLADAAKAPNKKKQPAEKEKEKEKEVPVPTPAPQIEAEKEVPSKKRKNPPKKDSTRAPPKKIGKVEAPTISKTETPATSVVPTSVVPVTTAPVVAPKAVVAPVYSYIPEPVQKQTHSTTSTANNKDKIIRLVRKILEDPRFNKVRQNPLASIPSEGDEVPKDPQIYKRLVDFAIFADAYLHEEWKLGQAPKDDFLDNLFAQL